MGENNRESFEEYYEKYYTQVFGYIVKKISIQQDAEDLTMESFVACYKHFEDFDENKASFGTWLYVVVNNKLKNYYRGFRINEDSDECDIAVNGFEEEIVFASYLSSMRKELVKALDNLSQVQRDIVIYSYFKGKNSNEIAVILGMSSGNVRVQLTRAISKLREYFNKNNIKWEK